MLTRLEYEVRGWGVGELWVDGETLLQHELPRPRPAPRSEPVAPASAALAGRFAAYFAGRRDSFADVVLDSEWQTPFQRAVVETLRRVPYGEVVTYGELAALAGYPGAQRAVGSVCARNRFAVVVPCHRVVAAAGLGPYGSLGVAYKRRLLELEGVAV